MTELISNSLRKARRDIHLLFFIYLFGGITYGKTQNNFQVELNITDEPLYMYSNEAESMALYPHGHPLIVILMNMVFYRRKPQKRLKSLH